MKRISKKTREQAALFCAIGASTGWRYGLGIGADAMKLALDAEHWCRADKSEPGWPVYCAEAESLLRTGWTP